MRRTYAQLTQEQRCQIYACLRAGWTQEETAKEIGVNQATISREARRNRGRRGYRPKQAHAKARARLPLKVKRRLADGDWGRVEGLLRLGWSPEQVSGRLEREGGLRVSHEWIYQHVYADKRAGGDLFRHLRCQKPRRKRYGAYDRRGVIPNRVGIARDLDARVFFAHPYASWERGVNENVNGLIRQYFPKKTDLSAVSREAVAHVMNRLNHRPRKSLGFRTPHEVFFHMITTLT
jgi:IS30 family transposase